MSMRKDAIDQGHKINRRTLLAGATALGATMIGGGSVLADNPPPFTNPDLEAAAKKDTGLRVVGSPGELPVIVKEFMKRFPWLTVEQVRASSGQLHQRFMTEMAAGVTNFDLIVNYDYMLKEADDKGYLAEYESTEAKSIKAPGAIIRPGKFYPYYHFRVANAWNTQAIGAGWKPESWLDMVKSDEGKGQEGYFMMPSPLGTYSVLLHLYALRQRYGLEYIEQLAALNPRMFPSQTAMSPILTTGGMPVALLFGELTAFTAWNNGAAPVSWAIPKEGTTASFMSSALVAGGQNVDAAHLFQEWLFSRDGQVVMQRTFGANPTRPDVDDVRPIPPVVPANAVDVWDIDWNHFAEVNDPWRQDLVRLFHL